MKILEDKTSNDLSYPQRFLKRITFLETLETNGNTQSLPRHYEVLYRAEDDPLNHCNTVEYYSRVFINYDIGKNFNISLFDFFSLTKSEIDILVDVAKDKLDSEMKIKKQAEESLTKGLK